MMTNKIILFSILLFSSILSGQQKIVSDFNIDKIDDTLIYKCSKNTEILGQPFCDVQIITGKTKKSYKFKIYYVKFAIIDTCGYGCISVFDDAGDTEYSQEYEYSKKHDDWILTKDEELLKYENNKTINRLSKKKYTQGISGKEYLKSKKKKN